jgi:hypothetical protein
MIKVMKPLAAAMAVAALSLAVPRLSSAETNKYCYDHPSDHSDYCYCYRHPKECNSQWRSNHPDWNHRPDEAYTPHHHHHPNQAYYNNQGHPPNGEGEYHGPPPNNAYHQVPPSNGGEYHGPPPNQGGNGHPNDYNQGGQQYH